ncbi:MAG: 30S ribosome-binding factor RbfA [Clostridia bacterium]|nr:30S ribosome-binding factor RbfA [Clostridia bacterium]
MANYRRGRINDEMQKTLAEILREVKDPRVSEAFISVTGADVTPDLKYAKVYYSALQGDKKEVKAGLKSSAGFIRRQVAQRMNLRVTPEFTFVEDESIAYGARISGILNSITITDPDEDGEDQDK